MPRARSGSCGSRISLCSPPAGLRADLNLIEEVRPRLVRKKPCGNSDVDDCGRAECNIKIVPWAVEVSAIAHYEITHADATNAAPIVRASIALNPAAGTRDVDAVCTCNEPVGVTRVPDDMASPRNVDSTVRISSQGAISYRAAEVRRNPEFVKADAAIGRGRSLTQRDSDACVEAYRAARDRAVIAHANTRGQKKAAGDEAIDHQNIVTQVKTCAVHIGHASDHLDAVTGPKSGIGVSRHDAVSHGGFIADAHAVPDVIGHT